MKEIEIIVYYLMVAVYGNIAIALNVVGLGFALSGLYLGAGIIFVAGLFYFYKALVSYRKASE